jgi:hypothetical protein
MRHGVAAGPVHEHDHGARRKVRVRQLHDAIFVFDKTDPGIGYDEKLERGPNSVNVKLRGGIEENRRVSRADRRIVARQMFAPILYYLY